LTCCGASVNGWALAFGLAAENPTPVETDFPQESTLIRVYTIFVFFGVSFVRERNGQLSERNKNFASFVFGTLSGGPTKRTKQLFFRSNENEQNRKYHIKSNINKILKFHQIFKTNIIYTY